MDKEVETSWHLSCVSDDIYTGEDLLTDTPKNGNMNFGQLRFSVLDGSPPPPLMLQQQNGTQKQPLPAAARRQVVPSSSSATTTTTTSDSESGISASGEGELCVEHEVELDRFCTSEQKLVCSHCADVGSCQGHDVTPLAARVTAVRNQLVDQCEKMQLKALRMERFINDTLKSKERMLLLEAGRARERALAQVKAVREALEEEEQRLLEEVQREEERVEQCLLTQRAHWSQALASLSATRSSLVHTLTHTPDAQLATATQEIADRVEEAEGLGEPCDTEQLNLNISCCDSRLLRGLWATARLLGPNAYGLANLKFDDRTVSPLLSLSDDLCTLTFRSKKLRQDSTPYDPARFDSWPNALGNLSISSGTHSWVLDVGKSGAFKVGVCYASVERKGSGNEARLGYNSQSWVLSRYDEDFSFCHAGKSVSLCMLKRPTSIGVLLDWPSQTLLFYEPDSCSVLYSVTHPFSAPLLPACALADHSLTILH